MLSEGANDQCMKTTEVSVISIKPGTNSEEKQRFGFGAERIVDARLVV